MPEIPEKPQGPVVPSPARADAPTDWWDANSWTTLLDLPGDAQHERRAVESWLDAHQIEFTICTPEGRPRTRLYAVRPGDLAAARLVLPVLAASRSVIESPESGTDAGTVSQGGSHA